MVPRTQRPELVHRPIEPCRRNRRRQRNADLSQGRLAIDGRGWLACADGHVAGDLGEDGLEAVATEGLDGEVGLDQGDAAADVDADGVRHDRAIGEQHASDRHAVAGVGVRHERDMLDRERQVRQVGRLLERGAVDVERPALDRHPSGLANLGRAVMAASAALVDASVDMATGPPAGMDCGDIIVAVGIGEANENRPLEIEGPVGRNAGAKGLPQARPPTIARITEMRGHDKPTERQIG